MWTCSGAPNLTCGGSWFAETTKSRPKIRADKRVRFEKDDIVCLCLQTVSEKGEKSRENKLLFLSCKKMSQRVQKQQ